MIKIWSKIYKNNKIVKQYVYEKEGTLIYSEFLSYLIEICYELDIATPVLLKTHLFNFAKFNFTKFRKSDFMESINFDSLVLENIFV